MGKDRHQKSSRSRKGKRSGQVQPPETEILLPVYPTEAFTRRTHSDLLLLVAPSEPQNVQYTSTHNYLFLVPKTRGNSTIIVTNDPDEKFRTDLAAQPYQIALLLTVHFSHRPENPADPEILHAVIIFCQGYISAIEDRHLIAQNKAPSSESNIVQTE